MALVGERAAKKLNQDYRQADYIPEVLAFPLQEEEPAGDGVRRWGDVVICFPQARQLAVKFNRPLDEVLMELLVHGLKNIFRR